MAWLYDDEVYERLSFRAIVSAWLRAMVLYLAEGKWSKEIENLSMWSFKYDMWCKMHFFGQQMGSQMVPYLENRLFAGASARTRTLTPSRCSVCGRNVATSPKMPMVSITRPLHTLPSLRQRKKKKEPAQIFAGSFIFTVSQFTVLF